MPKQVRGADGRVIERQMSDTDADVIARNVHAATGEVVTLIPFAWNEKTESYVLEEDQATTVGAPPVEEVEIPDVVTDDELKDLKVAQLKLLAAREEVDLTGATVKDDFIDAIKTDRAEKAKAAEK